ncbi:MAG: Gfo/Idh/MocA family protein [Fibrobacterota bacterium]
MRVRDKKEKLRCGIVGCGVIAPSHAESYLVSSDVEFAWVCDSEKEKAVRLCADYAALNICTDYKEMLQDEKLDCVSICTDHASHAHIASEFLSRGIDVLCEKPFAVSRSEISLMKRAAKQGNSILSGVLQHRFDRDFILIKKLIADGCLGKILNASLDMRFSRPQSYYLRDEWRGKWKTEGGSALINQAIHFIDILDWISGGIDSLCAVIDNLSHGSQIETEDTASAVLSFKNGATGSVNVTSSSHLQWEPRISIAGTSGTAFLGEKGIISLRPDNESLADSPVPEKHKDVNLKSAKDYYGSGHAAQISDFLGSVRTRRTPFVSAEDAGRAAEIIFTFYESSRDRGWKKVTGEDGFADEGLGNTVRTRTCVVP